MTPSSGTARAIAQRLRDGTPAKPVFTRDIQPSDPDRTIVISNPLIGRAR